MLLPISISDECKHDLMCATKLAGAVLDYVAGLPQGGFSASAFKAQSPAFKSIAVAKVVAALEALAQLSRVDRIKLRTAFKHDIEFHRHGDDDTFEFEYRKLDAHIRNAGQALLVAFYDHVLGGTGFKNLNGQMVVPLNRSTVESSLRKQNATLPLCPACLESLPEPVRERSLVDRDHFFPKSLYPPLSVHPYNLTLICKACNSGVKLDSDPIPGHQRGAITFSLLPYLRSGIDDVALVFDRDGDLRVQLIGPRRRPIVRERITNFDRLFAVSQRWGAYLESVDQTIRVQVLANAVGSLKPRDVKRVLEGMVEYEGYWKFTRPRSFVYHHYAKWLLQPDRLKRFTDTLNVPQSILPRRPRR